MGAVDEWGGESPGGRIEIELDEHEPARRRGRSEFKPAPAPPPAPAEPHESPPEPPSRNRLIAIAAGVGAAGVLVGWLAGSAGREDASSAAPAGSDAVAATTTPASFADDPALVEPDEPVLSAPPTTRQRPTTTTQPPIVVEPLTDLDPRLVGLPYEIVTLSSTGDVLYLDLVSGSVTTVDRRDRDDAGVLYAGDGWVAIPSANSNSVVVYHDGSAEPEIVRGFDAWSTRHQSGAATLWIPDDELLSGLHGSMLEIDSHGEPTGAAVRLPGHPFAIDSTGAFLVVAPGGTYAVTARGTSRLTTGTVAAYGATTAVVYECDEQLTCTTQAVDRATGERRELPGLHQDRPPDPPGWWGGSTTESISPDGRWAVLVAPAVDTSFGGGGVSINGWSLTSVDLVSGTPTQLDVEISWPSGVNWTADSRFAFFMGEGGLFAFDAQAGEVVPVISDSLWRLQMPTAVAVRPSDGNVWSTVTDVSD